MVDPSPSELRRPVSPLVMIEPILTGHKGFSVRGPATRTRDADEADPSIARIPGLWQRYVQGGATRSVRGALDAGVTVAVYTKYESDQDGSYTSVVGAPLIGTGESQLEHKTVEVPDGSYLLFEARGEMPGALLNTWERIRSYFAAEPPYTRLYSADFEIHDASEPDRVQVYVGVR